MKRRMLAVTLVLLAGCGRDTSPSTAEKGAAPQTEEKRAPGEVQLDPAMIRSGGVASSPALERSAPQVLRVSGRVTANEERTWRVGAVTEGRVIQLVANPGDTVTKGQVIARMHAHELHETRSEHQRAKTELARLQAQRRLAERSRDRAKRLYELKAASLEQLENAEGQLRDATAAVENATTELERTRIHLVEFLDVPADDHPDHKPGEFTHDEDLVPLRSPNSGVVIARPVTTGSVVRPGEEVYLISDLSVVWMIAALPEEHLSKVRTGMAARVTVQAYPNETFAGRITRLGSELDPQTRTVPVRILLENRSGKLRPEMYAAVEFPLGQSQTGVYIPLAAVQDLNGQAIVFVDQGGGKYNMRPVQLGRTEGESVEVLAGLKTGDQVVHQGAFVLKSQMLKSSLAEE